MTEVLLDVREPDEFEAERVPGSVNVPLSRFGVVAPGFLDRIAERNLVVLCRSGNRAKLAVEEVRRLGYGDKFDARVYEGGLLEWKRRGNPTARRGRARFPIMRQVQLVAGVVVFSTVLSGAFVHPAFLFASAFVGAGLTVAGATGFCGLAMLLAKMPWNRSVASTRNEPCRIDPDAGENVPRNPFDRSEE